MKKTTLRLVSGAMGILMALSFTACNEETIASAVNGKDGSAGAAGKSAFELYCEANGYEGTEEQWLDDLISGRLTPKTQVTLKFNSNGGSKCDDIVLDAGSSTTLPVPTKDGYYFAGWYVGEGANKLQVTSLTAINADMTLFAEWSTSPTFISYSSYHESVVMLGESSGILLIYTEDLSAHELQEQTTITVNYNGKDYTYGEAYRNNIVNSIYENYDYVTDFGFPVLELAVYPKQAGDYKITIETDRAEYSFEFKAIGYSIKSDDIYVRTNDYSYKVQNGADIVSYLDATLLEFKFDAYDIYNSASLEDFDISIKIDGQEVEAWDTPWLDTGYLHLMVDLANVGTASKSTVSVTVSKDGESATSTVSYQKLEAPADAEQKIVSGLQNASLYEALATVFEFHTYSQNIQENGASAEFTLTASDGTDMSSYFTANEPISNTLSTYGITFIYSLPVGTYTLTGTLKNASDTIIGTTAATITVLEPVEVTAPEQEYVYATAKNPAELVFTVNKEISEVAVYLGSNDYITIPLFKPNTVQTLELPGMIGTTVDASYTVSGGKTTVTVKLSTTCDNLFCSMVGSTNIGIGIETANGGEGFSDVIQCTIVPTSTIESYLPATIYSLETYFSEMMNTNERLKEIYDELKKIVADTKLSDMEKFEESEIFTSELMNIISNMEVPADFDIETYKEQIKAKIAKKLTVDDELKGTFVLNIAMGSMLYDTMLGTPIGNDYIMLFHMGEEEYLLNNATDAEILDTAYELLVDFSKIQGGIVILQIPGYAKGLSAVEQARNAYLENSTPESFEAYENALLDLMYISKMPI